MSKTDTTNALRSLRDEEMGVVTGGVLGPEPLGTGQLFWDPLWWQVGATGTITPPPRNLR